MHSFATKPFQETVQEGLQVASQVTQRANAALAEHTRRRIWLAVSLVPILIVVAVLLAYIRHQPLPAD